MRLIAVTSTTQKRLIFCDKYIGFLKMINEDDELKQWCKQYSAYKPAKTHKSLEDYIYHSLVKDAYDADMVVQNYAQLVEESGVGEQIGKPTESVLKQIDADHILGWIAWHFRRDHFCEGSLIQESIGDGFLLMMLEQYVEKQRPSQE